MSPTQKTLKALRVEGYKAGIVERWLRYAGQFGKRQDLFGIIDIIAISKGVTLGVQCCSGSIASHYRKLVEEKNQECYDWLTNPDRHLEIWGWRKLKSKKLLKNGKKSKATIWAPNIKVITLEDLEI